MRIFLLFISVLTGMLSLNAFGSTPDLILRGSVSGADHQHYRQVPFVVPPGVARLTVEFAYTGKEQRSVIDLGLMAPDKSLRGWSGGSKSIFTVSDVDATPSYLPTATVPGQWALLLGIPNLRKGVTSAYTAKIYFSKTLAASAEPDVLRQPLLKEARWYRGDLHMHTAFSDGSCTSRAGKNVPCPLFLTVQAANARGLDFIAITDHNSVTQASAIRELQPYFDRLLLLQGREVTTFYGHANLFGTLAPLDFRIAPGAKPDWNALLAAVPKEAMISINHPIRPSGEDCMGCGWEQATDMRLVQGIEVVNGGDADTIYSGVPFWQRQLDRGFRISAVGGSDNHHADVLDAVSPSVGSPTTVVYAPELSQLAILDAIRAGHVFIDVTGSADRLIELTGKTDDAPMAMMGDVLQAASGSVVHVGLHVGHVAGGDVRLLLDGKETGLLPNGKVGGDDWRQEIEWRSDGQVHTLRAEARDANGKLILLSNPIYLNSQKVVAASNK